jgi:hypothetical protein
MAVENRFTLGPEDDARGQDVPPNELTGGQALAHSHALVRPQSEDPDRNRLLLGRREEDERVEELVPGQREREDADGEHHPSMVSRALAHSANR